MINNIMHLKEMQLILEILNCKKKADASNRINSNKI